MSNLETLPDSVQARLYYLTRLMMFCASCKDGEDTVSEELQCVSARGGPLVEKDLFGCYRYIDPLELPLLYIFEIYV
jgi:hypothetical protein